MINKEDKELLDLIAQTLYDKKGFNILVLDVSKFSSLADAYVIAEGNVERHVKALANEVVDRMNEKGHSLYHMDSTSPDWVVLDFGYIIVHLMIPETREYYAIEELWRNGDIVDVNIHTDAK